MRKTVPLGVRKCTEQDFGTQVINDLPFTMYCPENENFGFIGNSFGSSSTHMSVSMHRCTKENKLVDDQECAEENEIDEWVENYGIMTFN